MKQCPACSETASSKTHQPPPQLPEEMLVLGPMDRLGIDICHLGNKNLLVMVDMYSNYKWVKELKKLSSEEVIRIMEGWFCSTGLPRCIRSDGGPQFRSTYANWLASLGIIQETSSPYNSASNGLAEKAIKDVKNVLKRQEGRYDIDRLMAEYNSMARMHMDASPADLFFNRVVRSTTPGSGRRNLDLESAQQK